MEQMKDEHFETANATGQSLHDKGMHYDPATGKPDPGAPNVNLEPVPSEMSGDYEKDMD